MLSALIALAFPGPIDIRDFGAIGDGTTMCTLAIQKAIDKAAAGRHGIVLVPAGRFLSGTLRLRSHVELRLEKDAVLLGSARRHDYEKGVWYALLLAQNLEDVSITGSGTIDGQGAALANDVLRLVRIGELKIPPKGWRPSELDRPEIIEMDSCRGVRIEGVTIKNSCCWVQTYRDCIGLDIKGIKVDSKTYWNNDGVDILDCKDSHVSNCDIDADDDGICLKSDRRETACEHVTVDNCRIRSSASAIKFGTSSHGGFRHIRISGIQVRDTFRSAVALESVDGGILEDVVVSNVKATHTGNAFFIRLGHRNLKAPVGRVRRVVLRNMDVEVPAGRPDEGYPFHGPEYTEPHNVYPSSIVGHPEVPIEGVLLENIRIHMPGGGSPQVASRPVEALATVPERVENYPEYSMFGELPAWALYVRHVRGLTIKGFTVSLDRADYRPAFVIDDASQVIGRQIGVTGAGKPDFVVRHGRHVDVTGVRPRSIK